MEYSYTPSLSPDLPNMGSVLKGLGYRTAYFGKVEMDSDASRRQTDGQLVAQRHRAAAVCAAFPPEIPLPMDRSPS